MTSLPLSLLVICLVLLGTGAETFLGNDKNTAVDGAQVQRMTRPKTRDRIFVPFCGRQDVFDYELEAYEGSHSEADLQASDGPQPNHSLCQKRKISYILEKVGAPKQGRRPSNITEFASFADHLYIVDVSFPFSVSSLVIYAIKRDSSGGLNLQKLKALDLTSLVNLQNWESFSQKDLSVYVTAKDKLAFIKIISRILVFDLEKPFEPILLASERIDPEEFYGIKKVFFHESFVFKLRDSLINITSFDKKSRTFTRVHDLEYPKIGKLVNETYKLNQTWGAIADIWVDSNRLYVLDGSRGLIVLNTSKLFQGASELGPSDLLAFQEIADGSLIKKSGQSVAIVIEVKEARGRLNYFQLVEFLESNGQEATSAYNISLNRVEGLNFTTIKSLHSTKDYLLIEQNNFITIMKHSFPKLSEVIEPQYPMSFQLTPGLKSFHHTSLASEANNLVMAIYSDEVIFYEVRTDNITASCKPSKSDDKITLVAYLKTSNNCSSSQSSRVCVEKLITQLSVEGVDDSPNYKLIFTGIFLAIGWIIVILISLKLRNKWKERKIKLPKCPKRFRRKRGDLNVELTKKNEEENKSLTQGDNNDNPGNVNNENPEFFSNENPGNGKSEFPT